MPLAEKGVRGKAAGLAPPQHTETRSAISAPSSSIGEFTETAVPVLGFRGLRFFHEVLRLEVSHYRADIFAR